MMMSAALRYVGPALSWQIEVALLSSWKLRSGLLIQKKEEEEEEEEEEEGRRREEEVEKEGGRVGHLVAFDLGHLRGPLARACIHNITIALYTTNTVYNIYMGRFVTSTGSAE